MSDERFLVSGWEDDLQDIDEHRNPTEEHCKQLLEYSEKGDLAGLTRVLDAHPEALTAADEDGYTALHRACYANQEDAVRLLLSRGADITARTQFGWQPLHSCCQWGHSECAVLLLQAGADPNAASEGGQTPLHIAASHGANYAIVMLLLMHPYIDPALRNNSGEKAYDIARRSSMFYKIFEMGEL